MKKSPTRKCCHCGSKLILISKKTIQLEGSRFSQTVCEYRCSNIVCQDERDRETEKRIKLQKDKEMADKKRKEDKANTKKISLVLGKTKRKN